MIGKLLKRFMTKETGAAMVEYAIALLVAAGIGVTVFSGMGTKAGMNSYDACMALAGDDTAAQTECGTRPTF